jgi:uncharacterized protein
MLIHELTHEQCRAFLQGQTLARLGCAQANQPYVTPISFHYRPEDGRLYCFATGGQKIEWMRRNPRVCVEVDDIVDRFNWTTVVIAGRYEELKDLDAAAAALDRARDLFEAHPSWWLPAAGRLASGTEHSTRVIFRISIATMTGRRASSR